MGSHAIQLGFYYEIWLKGPISSVYHFSILFGSPPPIVGPSVMDQMDKSQCMDRKALKAVMADDRNHKFLLLKCRQEIKEILTSIPAAEWATYLKVFPSHMWAQIRCEVAIVTF